MKVLLSWLREFVDVTVEPAKLAEDLTRAGLAVDGLETHDGDTLFDLDITTNRVDCMNVYGVAREIAAMYGTALRPIETSLAETGEPASKSLSVRIDAPELCPRFAARVLDVRMGPAPAWMRERLERMGTRSISNVVDLTNYVMLEMGQPSHAFDLARIPGGALHVRWASAGEKLKTLDGVERTLEPKHGVVAGNEALALAGIMGGSTSEVGDDTRTVALEAAYWEPLVIRRGARALGMHTEASHRFERGADPEAPPQALDRIAHLLAKIGAGSARPGRIDVIAAPKPARRAVLRLGRVNAVLGTDVPEVRVREVLGHLGFVLESEGNAAWNVVVPSWRGDVAREADLVEEVGRHHGLDRIPKSLPPSHGVEGLRPAQRAERTLRDVLVGAGLDEVITYAFVAVDGQELPPALRLQNPLSEEQSVLRTSLMPGLLSVLRTNLRHGRRDVRIFEIGRVFRDSGTTLAGEERRVGVLWTGSDGAHWSQKPRAVDFFDLKGLLEMACARQGWPLPELRAGGALPPLLHPGKAASLVGADGATLGFLGALHPDVAADLELRDDAFVLEMTLDGLLARPATAARVRSIPRSPAVTRDVSALVSADVGAAEVQDWIRGSAGPLLTAVRLLDRYDKPPVPAGRVSLTLSLVFQDPERTLTGDEVEAAMTRVREDLVRRGAEVRGE